MTLVGASMRAAEFDVARLEARAGEGGTTLTELADHLAREHDVPFRTAHAIAARLSGSCAASGPDAARGDVAGRLSGDARRAPASLRGAEIAEIMSPRHFVEVRRTTGRPVARRDLARPRGGRALSRRRPCLAGRTRAAVCRRRGTAARAEPESVTTSSANTSACSSSGSACSRRSTSFRNSSRDLRSTGRSSARISSGWSGTAFA